jgi:catabolite regulation protein CreA
MNWLKNFAKGIASLFHRQDVERELDEELQGYLEASAAHKQRDGMTKRKLVARPVWNWAAAIL